MEQGLSFPQIVICGYGRSGSSLLYAMLKSTVISHKFCDGESSCMFALPEFCTKRPFDIFEDIPERIKIVITIRDIRDILTSIHSRVPDEFFYDYNFCRSTQFEGTINKGIIQTHNAIKEKSGIFIKYEDLVKYPAKIQKKLSGLFEFNGKFEDFYKFPVDWRLEKAMNGLRKLEKSKTGRWKKFPERIKDQFEKCPELFDILIEYGYEKDKSWIRQL